MDDEIEKIPLNKLKSEEGAEDLLESAAMEPYMNLMLAIMQGKDSSAAVEALAALPLEKRYVWRIASALKWAFADFDTVNVQADRRTLSPEERKKLFELLKHRPTQLCMFMSALFGQKRMEILIAEAIRSSRAIAESQTPDEPTSRGQ